MKLGHSSFFKLVFFLSLIAGFFSCKKDNSNVLAPANFQVQLNGVAWQGDRLEIKVEREEVSANIFAKVLRLTSFRGDTSYLQITVNDVRNTLDSECMSVDSYWGYDHPNIAENYFLEDGGIIYRNGSAFELVPNQFGAFSSFEGTVHIDDCQDNKISGSFEFSIKDAILDSVIYQVTNGKFENQEYEFIN